MMAFTKISRFLGLSGDKPRKDQTSGRSARSTPLGEKVKLPDVKPWPEAVEGAAVLDEIRETILGYLSLPDGAAEAMALWVMFTHAFDAAEVSPRLALTSPVPGCGKTTALTILSNLVRRPLPASNWTTATVFRFIERDKPTLLIDEADTFMKDAEGLRGILNSGHTQGMAFVMRCVGENDEPRQFSTWAPIAMAKIGDFPRTLEERSVVIPMRKRRPEEKIERFRPDKIAELNKLARKTARWAKDHVNDLRQADPEMLEPMTDRTADNWRPLFAIADSAGSHWPDTARKVALQLSSGSENSSSEVQLLANIRAAFKAHGVDRLSSETLGKVVDSKPHALARCLQLFGIRPHVIRTGVRTPRGYMLADFEDAFARYLPPQTATTQHPKETAVFSNFEGATRKNDVAVRNAA